MVADDGSGKHVDVFEPLAADYLMKDLQTTYDKFNPNEASIMERGIDRLFGDVSKGFQETEQMLPIESYIMGFGQLALWRGEMQLMHIAFHLSCSSVHYAGHWVIGTLSFSN